MILKKISLFLFVLTVLLQSCCKEPVCISFEEVNQVNFHNYRVSDVDTVLIKTISVSGNDTTLKDNSLYEIQASGYRNTELKLFLNDPLSKSFQYLIIVPSVSDTFLLNNFVTEKDKCRGGCGPNYEYEYLREFEINSIKFYGRVIDIVNQKK